MKKPTVGETQMTTIILQTEEEKQYKKDTKCMKFMNTNQTMLNYH